MIKFEILTPLGFTVRTSEDYWSRVIAKHPDIEDLENFVRLALSEPEQVRCSSRDPAVLLFYRLYQQEKRQERWVVAVARRLNGDGFLITAYQTDAIKEGETIWLK